MTKHLVLVLVSIVAIFLLGRLVNWESVGHYVSTAHRGWLLASFLLVFLFPVLNAIRWVSVLRANGSRMGTWEAFRITMALWPVGNLAPAKAGDAFKAAFVPNRIVGLGCVVVERVVDVAVLGAYGLVFGLLSGSAVLAAGGLLAAAAGLGGAVTIAFAARWLARKLEGKKWGEKLSGFLRAGERLRAHPRLFAACVLSSALNWFLSMLQLYCLLSAVGHPVPLGSIVAALPAATFAGLLPVTIAGAGTRDAAFLLLLGSTVEAPALLAASILYTLQGYFLLGLLGLPFWATVTVPPASNKAPRR